MEQVDQITTTPQDHTTLQSLIICTLNLQLRYLVIIEIMDLHQLISLQVIAEIEAVQDQEVHLRQIDQVEATVVHREVKEVVHRLNQEEEDKHVFIDYHK